MVLLKAKAVHTVALCSTVAWCVHSPGYETYSAVAMAAGAVVGAVVHERSKNRAPQPD